MRAEAIGDQRHHRLCGRIGRECRRWRHRERLGQRFAVLRVVIPLAAGRRAIVHQNGVTTTHLAIEELHPHAGPAARPGQELGIAAQEAGVVADIDLEAGQVVPVAEILHQAVFAGLGDDDPVRPLPLDRAQHLAPERAGVGGVVELDILDRHAAGLKGGREVPHRRQHEHDLLGMVLDVGALGHDFGHQDPVLTRVQILERAEMSAALVAEDHS